MRQMGAKAPGHQVFLPYRSLAAAWSIGIVVGGVGGGV